MKIIGLCGQSGAGKTTALEAFSKAGLAVVDCDVLARVVTQPPSPCLDELRQYFGNEIICENGSLDRRGLAKIAFSTPENHAALNRITHRHILILLEERIKRAEEDGYTALVIDAPLLFESGLDIRCDIVVALISPLEVRLERIMARDTITRDEALARITRQISEEELVSRSDYVICNDEDTAKLKNKVFELVQKIGEKP